MPYRVPQNTFSQYPNQYRPCFHTHPSLSFSNIIIICKIIVLIGLLITFFSDQWAIDPTVPDTYAGYKKRCSEYSCTSKDAEPLWIFKITCFLAVINFNIELVNILLLYCHVGTVSNLRIVIEIFMFFSTFTLTVCLILYGICILIYSDRVPMGQAFTFFIISISFCIIDWACSLRRLIISLPDTEILSYNHSPTSLDRTNRLMCEPSQYIISSSNSITASSTYV